MTHRLVILTTQLEAALWESSVGPSDFLAWVIYNAARQLETPEPNLLAARRELGQALLFPNAKRSYAEFLAERSEEWREAVKRRNARLN